VPIAGDTARRAFAAGARALFWAAAPAALVLAGCGSGVSAFTAGISVSPSTASVDTNCTGCNATDSSGKAVEQFSATLANGSAASVNWSVSGGDSASGAGTISSSGQYTPPAYLTADSVQVIISAKLKSGPSSASTTLTLTPGFLEPLTPENAAVGSGGTLSITGYLAEAGGTDSIDYALSSTASGSGGGLGSLGLTTCQRSSSVFTSCTVTYTAPAVISSAGAAYAVAGVANTASKASTQILLNTAGLQSDPASHQSQLPSPILLGSSGGNNKDYDTNGNQIVDCCSGTLGSLVQNSSGRQFLLGNNHVLARSDQAGIGEAIVQPGLIDNNCTPYGSGAGTTPVGVLSGFLPLSSSSTNADAAIAQVNSGAVNSSGAILELGAEQPDGSLAAAPPGVSSTGGKGETASLHMTVAKSGRSTGLTCASISAVSLNVEVSYYTNCAETSPYLTRTYTGQLGIEGNQFSDAGDSGSLVVNTSNAEPVGLFFAGGVNQSGVSEGIASPAPDVLSELSAQMGGGSFTFVGGADHPVSCLNYGDSTLSAANARVLSIAESERTEKALGQARFLVSSVNGVLGVALGKSSDYAGEGAVIFYVDPNSNAKIPATVHGVRTVVIPTSARAVTYGAAPESMLEAGPLPALSSTVLNQAVATEQQVALHLMKQNPSFFGVGVGQSLDNPREAALVVYVDRKQIPPNLPAVLYGLRTRYVVMDRLHVTRSYATSTPSRSHCMARSTQQQPPLLSNPLNLHFR
jgi:hypothetical protein